MLDEPDPPPSRLLLLPPEIRTLILEELIPRARCARGYTRVDLAAMNSAVHRGRGRPPWTSPKQTKTSIPVSYLQTCRELYEEGSHFFYSTSVFHFEDLQAISQFVYRRSLAQLCTIQHLRYTLPNMISCLQSWNTIDDELHHDALDIFDVMHTTRKLQNLQNLDLLVNIVDYAEYTRENGENEYPVQIIYRLLDHVNNSDFVPEDHDLCDYVKAPSVEILDHCVIKQKEWGPHSSEEFATSGWVLLHLECQKSSIASPTHKATQEVHTNYVLRTITWYDRST